MSGLVDSPKPDSEEEKFEKVITKSKQSPTKDDEETKEPSDKVWDRDSKMPPQMMKRWFGGNPQTD